MKPVSIRNLKALAARLTITHQRSQTLAPLTLTPIQIDWLTCVNQQQASICLKARQIYITTASLLYVMAYCLTNPATSAAIILDTREKATEKLQIVWDWLIELGVELADATQRELVLPNKSRIRALSAVSRTGQQSRTGRGLTFNLLCFSELGFYNEAESVWAALTATNPNAKVIVESTSSGPAGLFFNLYNSQSNWARRFYGLEQHEVFQIAPEAITDAEWQHYQGMGFSSRPHAAFFNSYLVNKLLGDLPRAFLEFPVLEAQAWSSFAGRFIAATPPIIPNRQRFGFDCFHEPEPGQSFIYGYDPAGGKGRDKTAISILDRHTGRLMASLHDSEIEADEVLERLKQIRTIYPSDEILLEENGIGGSIAPFARKQGIPIRLVWTNDDDKYINFLNVKRAVESGNLAGCKQLQTEVGGLGRNDKGKWVGHDDLLCAIGFCLTHIARHPIAKPPDPIAPNTYNARAKLKAMDRGWN